MRSIYFVILTLATAQISFAKYASELIRRYGYPMEVHTDVQTDDGYLLTMHRIPHGKSNKELQNRPPVLLMHGLFGSAEHFLFSGPNKSLGFLLAEQGYDVWMGNIRSVSCSKKHVNLDPDADRAYWNFTMQELGVHDLRTKIDYVLKTTGSQRLHYVAHSLGNMMLFVLCSELPHYNDKVNVAIALAPAAYVYQLSHPWMPILRPQIPMLHTISDYFGINEIAPGRSVARALGPVFCTLPFMDDFCKTIIFSVAGFNSEQFDNNNLADITVNAPEGVAASVLFHLAQLEEHDYFRKYNYGEDMNKEMYGSENPPSYDLGKVTVPIGLYYAENDWFLPAQSVKRLSTELPNIIDLHKMEVENFAHVDFLWGKDVVPLLYERIFSVMEHHRKYAEQRSNHRTTPRETFKMM